MTTALHGASLIGCVERAARRWQVSGVDGQTLTLPFALTAVD